MKLKTCLVILVAGVTVTAVAQQISDDKHPQKLRISWNVMKGNLEHKVEPELPNDENGKPMHGHVTLRINIGKGGNVVSAVRWRASLNWRIRL